MSVTILASLFLVLLLLIAFIGFRAGLKPATPTADVNTAKCAICREQFAKSLLIERQIGDHALMHFCPACITALHTELTQKN